MTFSYDPTCRQPGAIALLVLISPISLHANEAETLKNRFLDEAPRAWGEYRAYAERLQGTVQSTWTIQGEIRSSHLLEYKSNLNCKIVRHQSLLTGHPAEDVHAFNPFYGFTLNRKSSDESWVLSGLQMGEFHGSHENWEEFIPLRLCISAHLYELPELVRLPNFRVVRAGSVQHDGTDLCRIDFESNHTSGTLLLDPKRFWTAQHCTLREQSSNEIVVTRQNMELSESSAKYPIPKRWVVDKSLMGANMGKRDAQLVTEFALKEISRLPDDKEFTLSAFGLPEPIGVKPPERLRIWVWLFAAALGLAALAILFAWLKRRRMAAVHMTIEPPSDRGVS